MQKKTLLLIDVIELCCFFRTCWTRLCNDAAKWGEMLTTHWFLGCRAWNIVVPRTRLSLHIFRTSANSIKFIISGVSLRRSLDANRKTLTLLTLSESPPIFNIDFIILCHYVPRRELRQFLVLHQKPLHCAALGMYCTLTAVPRWVSLLPFVRW